MALIESYEGVNKVSIDPFYIVRKILNIPQTVKGIYLLRRLNKELRAPLLDFSVVTIYNAIAADIEVYREGYLELIRILRDPKQIEDILNKAYKHIRTLLREYLKKDNKGVMISNYRKGFTSVKKAEYQARWEKTENNPRYYSGLWKQIVDMIEGPPKRLGPDTFTSFSLEDLLSVEVSSEHSDFKSVFMMEEFGTGQEADPQLRRPFTSFGSTPYKVPPELAKGSGERNVQYLWWPRRPWQAYALRFAAGLQQKKRFLLTLQERKRVLKEAQRLNNQLAKFGLTKKRTFAEMHKFAMQTIRRYDRLKKRGQKAESKGGFSPLELAYGFKQGHKHPGRKARHLLFDNKRGIVQKIRDIREEGQKEVARQLDAKIQKIKKGKFKDFPSIYRILFPGG